MSYAIWVLLAAIVLFWAVGAYNRLIQLRTAALSLVEEIRVNPCIDDLSRDRTQQHVASAIEAYNNAVAQFPASLLANLFGLKPLDPSGRPSS